ncbi:MAG: hypothetical protein K0S65_5434, partial [Labilithrix sp.]|nr:hypothetical protein [Labilithrix sp.]
RRKRKPKADEDVVLPPHEEAAVAEE